MTHEITNKQGKPIRGRVRELMNKGHVEDPEKVNAKRKRLLTLLEKRYGYTNDQAVEELERLLKQFYRTNRNLGIHPIRPNANTPDTE